MKTQTKPPSSPSIVTVSCLCSQGVAIMFLMKAQFMHDIFQINTGDPNADEELERRDSSIIQVTQFTPPDNPRLGVSLFLTAENLSMVHIWLLFV